MCQSFKVHRAEAQKLNPQWEPETPVRKSEAITGKSLKVWCGRSLELRTLGRPRQGAIQPLWALLWRSTGSHGAFQRKTLLFFEQGMKYETFWNKPGHPVFLNQVCPQEKRFAESLMPWVYFIWVSKENTELTSKRHIPSKAGKSTECLWSSHPSGAQP